jgi:hypothetical protein
MNFILMTLFLAGRTAPEFQWVGPVSRFVLRNEDTNLCLLW